LRPRGTPALQGGEEVSIKKKKGWNNDPNTWSGKIYVPPNIVKKKKGWNNDPNTWSGKIYVPPNIDKEKIKRILTQRTTPP